MTVRELIEALRHQDPDALVCALAQDGEEYEEVRQWQRRPCLYVRGNVSTRRPPGDYNAVVLET